jgi:hypothetical protein
MDTRRTSYTCINKIKQQTKPENNAEKEQKWVTFIYTGNYIKITKLFKDTNLKIAFITTSTIGKLLNKQQEMNSYKRSGIYKITYQSCHKVYIGQTGRNLTKGYKEHIRNIKHNKDESAFARYILNKCQQYGSMTEIMEMIEHAKKRQCDKHKKLFTFIVLINLIDRRAKINKRDR